MLYLDHAATTPVRPEVLEAMLPFYTSRFGNPSSHHTVGEAAAAALGYDPAQIEVLIGQMVSLVRDGKPVRMSKRAGTVVVLDDLVQAVGRDAARYAITRTSIDSPLDIDLDLLAKRSNDNPVFYVQYAHARTCNVARLAAEDGVRREDGFDPALLSDPSEAALLAILGELPRVVEQAARLREPHRVARYLEDLAGRFHKWYDTCRVRPQNADEPVTDEQVRLLRRKRMEGKTLEAAAVAAGMRVVVVPNDVTGTQPFPPEWARLDGFEGGLEGLLAAVR